jgi:PAS domain S-box-containing protein
MPTNSIDLLWAIISASALGVVLVSTILALLYINQRKVIATQRENLHQLEERELKYRNLFENSLVAMFRIELMNGTILESNNLFLKTLGTATKEEASKLFQSQNIAALNSITEAVQKQGIIEHFETPFKRSDGTTIWTSLSAKHFPAEGYIEGMMIDITEKKNLERQFHTILITFFLRLFLPLDCLRINT